MGLMLVAYIDESYDNREYVGYWMTAVIVREKALATYWEALLAIANGPGLALDTELHGSDLFHGDKAFKGMSPNDRIAVYRRGLEVVREHALCVLVAAHIPDSEGAPSLMDWRMSVLSKLVPEIERVARAQSEFVVLVCDEEHSTTSRVVQLLHDGKASYGVHGTPILETAMFCRSQHSPGVWPADLAAFLERRIDLGYGDDAKRRSTLRRLRSIYQEKREAPVIITGTFVV